MNFRNVRAMAIALALAGSAAAQDVGSTLPDFELADFGSTRASALDDFVGRTVLLEFFAYW